MIKWDTLKTVDDKLTEYKQSKRQWMNTERDRLIASGVSYGGNTYQSRSEDITNIMGAVQVAQIATLAEQEFSTEWLTNDNQVVPMGLHELAGLGVALAEHKKHYIYKCREHKEAMDDCDTMQAVNDYIAGLSW